MVPTSTDRRKRPFPIAAVDMALEGLAANAFWTRPDAPPRRRGCRRGGGRRSSLRQSGLAHAFENALRLGQIFWVTALGGEEGAGAGDGEIWVQREARADRGTRTVKSPELRQRGSQLKMRFRKISVGFDGPPSPRDRFLPNAHG